MAGYQPDDHEGDIANVIINDNWGPVHLGNGDIIVDSQITDESPTVTTVPEGTVVIQGDFHGTISHRF